MQGAKLFTEIARGPEGGQAFRLTADDGVGIRIGLWTRAGLKGTVFLLPGRTEFVEKYGPAAAELMRRGYATLVIDWRGQGLSDRTLADCSLGHIERFGDYQRDLKAAVAAARALRLPLPWHMLAHSMGCTIGLRALIEGSEMRSAVFSAPMWGIVLPGWKRPLARPLTGLARKLGMGHRPAPGSPAANYVLSSSFLDNTLTGDRAMFDFMRSQLRAHPELALGGASMAWVNEALNEIRALRGLATPDIPALAVLGSDERIVEPAPVVARMADWADGRLERVEGARHEIMMENREHRRWFYDKAVVHFATAPEKLRKISVYR